MPARIHTKPLGWSVTLVAILALVSVLSAQDKKISRPRPGAAGQWRVIGTVEAGFTADHDQIVVVGPFDDFRRIKFKVTGADLNLDRLVVTYDNGAPDRLRVREEIRQGGESRAIDLRGIGARSVRKIRGRSRR